MTSERGTRLILRPLRSLAGLLVVLWNAWRNLEERIRSSFLTLILTLIYFLLMTPLGWQKRSDRKNEIVSWRKFGERIGWRPNEQSTSDPQIYLSALSSRDDLLTLLRMKKVDHSTLLMYDALSPLEFLAKPPKEKELSSDLYIMF